MPSYLLLSGETQTRVSSPLGSHGTGIIISYTCTTKNQPFMQVNLPFVPCIRIGGTPAELLPSIQFGFGHLEIQSDSSVASGIPKRKPLERLPATRKHWEEKTQRISSDQLIINIDIYIYIVCHQYPYQYLHIRIYIIYTYPSDLQLIFSRIFPSTTENISRIDYLY